MAIIQTYEITATSTGAAGSSTGTGTSAIPVRGRILGVYLDYTNQPATTDVTLATQHSPIENILVKANNATDGWFYPRYQIHDAAGAAVAGLYPA